jgi:T-complex protein 1 subunit delta
MDNQVFVSDYNAMDQVLREERAYIIHVAVAVKKAGCNVLLVQKLILRFVLLHRFVNIRILI